MRNGTLRLVFCAGLLWSACHADELVGLNDGAPQMDASSICGELTAQTYAWLADPAHFTCTVDSDCVSNGDQGFIYDRGASVSCWPRTVISKSGDVGFKELLGEMRGATCTGPSNICSGSLCGAPVCNMHACVCR